jgi:hypothetical protein
MDSDKLSILDVSIELELRVGDLYSLFGDLFPDDKNFWWDLALEERGHAAIIRSGKEHFLPLGKFSYDMLADDFEEIKAIVKKLVGLIEKYKEQPPSREEAFNLAFAFETSAGEAHYQAFMRKDAESDVDLIFQKLNREDKDHALRINVYMKGHDIPYNSNFEI